MPYSHLTAATCAMRDKLDTVRSILHLLKDGLLSDAERRHFIDLAIVAGQDMLDVVTRVDELAAIKTGVAGATSSPVDVLRMLDSCLNIAGAQAFGRQIRIAIAAPPALPQVKVDERRFKRAILDLLSYIIRATPSGGTITVSVSLGDNLCILMTGRGRDQRPEETESAVHPIDFHDVFDILVAEELIRLHDGSLRLVRHGGHATSAIVQLPGPRLLDKSGTPLSAIRGRSCICRDGRFRCAMLCAAQLAPTARDPSAPADDAVAPDAAHGAACGNPLMVSAAE